MGQLLEVHVWVGSAGCCCCCCIWWYSSCSLLIAKVPNRTNESYTQTTTVTPKCSPIPVNLRTMQQQLATASAGNRSFVIEGTSSFVPFIGISIGRNPKQLVLRLYYSTRDCPMKHFIIDVPESSLGPPHAAIWYEVEHLKPYADNVVIITCTSTPAVAEGWHAGRVLVSGHVPCAMHA